MLLEYENKDCGVLKNVAEDAFKPRKQAREVTLRMERVSLCTAS
jgi:hypothetical protein